MSLSTVTKDLQTLSITIKGNTPSKKNSRRPFVRGGRMMNFPSKRYTEWHKDATIQLKGSKLPSPDVLPLKIVEHTTLTFYAPNKRKYDLSNRAESIMDLLVDCGIIEDDNWSVIPRLEIIHGGVDKNNARCDILLAYEKSLSTM